MNNGRHARSIFLVALAAALGLVAGLMLWLPGALAAEPSLPTVLEPSVMIWGFASAAAATGLSALGAAYAVASVGSAGIGALAEKPELMGRVLVLVGLAEGIAIYGLIVSILILNSIT